MQYLAVCVIYPGSFPVECVSSNCCVKRDILLLKIKFGAWGGVVVKALRY